MLNWETIWYITVAPQPFTSRLHSANGDEYCESDIQMFHNHFNRAVLQNQCLPYLEMQEYYIYLNGMININESQKTIIC